MNCCNSYENSCEAEISFEPRRFFTSEEKIQMLKDYQNYLEKEALGVKEKISRLEKEKNSSQDED